MSSVINPDCGLSAPLPTAFTEWFVKNGWQPHRHQLELLAAAKAGQSALVIAPTGGGKTLAGFLPSLVELSQKPQTGLHTIYISPLKALAVDIERNLSRPVQEMNLPIRIETRTGDTPPAKRQRQRRQPPEILLTTPESLALLIAQPEAAEMFANVQAVIIDELHALVGSKRGDLLSLGLARISTFTNGNARRIGLSATVAYPEYLSAYVSPTGTAAGIVRIVADPGPEPEIDLLIPAERMPWAGHMALFAMPEIYNAIKSANTTLLFVNTRAQAELVFQELWRRNDDNLPIALHHGSLAIEQRRKVEAAMARGALRAVVATSSLDLGIDWAAVDLVLQIGAPKGSSRLLQRIGRANHRLDCPSRALLVPANRFEVLECRAAKDAIHAGALDGDAPRIGGLDVLAQHVLGTACAGPFDPTALYHEITNAAPYSALSQRDFDDVVAFVTNGGYALGVYDRFRRLRRRGDGKLEIAGPDDRRRYRMNVGTIVEASTVKVRLKRGRVLGEIEEYFVQMLRPGDCFIFAGMLLEFVSLRETVIEVIPGRGEKPLIPAYAGGRLPLSTHLSTRVREMLADPTQWDKLPSAVQEWLELQQSRSSLPDPESLLVETFPRGGKEFLVAYCFEGRNAHQTLGMLLTKRLEKQGAGPLGFVASDYALATWSLRAPLDVDALFTEDILGEELEEWMAESSLLKRTFRNVAVIAGLIDRKLPGQKKTGKQVLINSNLIYDVLRRHEPDHILLRATRADAAQGLLDIVRLGQMLNRIQGKILHRRLARVSPLAVPVMLDIGREQVYGQALGDLFAETEAELIAEATGTAFIATENAA